MMTQEIFEKELRDLAIYMKDDYCAEWLNPRLIGRYWYMQLDCISLDTREFVAERGVIQLELRELLRAKRPSVRLRESILAAGISAVDAAAVDASDSWQVLYGRRGANF